MRCCHVLWGYDSPVVMVDFNSDLDVAVSGSESGRICLHTLRRGEFLHAFQPPPILARGRNHPHQASAIVKLAIDMGVLVVHTEDQGLHTYTMNSVRLCNTHADEKLNDLHLCSDDQILVMGRYWCQVLVWTRLSL